MSGWVKLHSSILDSSVWEEGPSVRLVWITMLAMSDASGFVRGTPRSLSRRANVPLADATNALQILSSPDSCSRSQVEDGRRILPEPGGWRLVNYLQYRSERDQSERREYQRRWIATKRSGSVDTCRQVVDRLSTHVDTSSTVSTQAEAEAEAEAEDISLAPLEPKKPRKEPLSKEEGEFLDWWCSRVQSTFGVSIERPISGPDVILLHKLAKRQIPWKVVREAVDWALTDSFEGKNAANLKAVCSGITRLIAGMQVAQRPTAPRAAPPGAGQAPTEKMRLVRERYQRLCLEQPLVIPVGSSNAEAQRLEREHDQSLKRKAEEEVDRERAKA